jgi:dTDP-4-amino-4,6-dideoxygalactose transaminase
MSTSESIVRLSRSIVGRAEADAAARVIVEDGYLGMGAEVARFEGDLAAYLGVDAAHVSCVSSGTAAVQLAVEAVVQPGDEVLVQSLTFVATFQAIAAAGAVPVACEVTADTVSIDLEDAARRCTSRTRAIMPVHYASNPGDLDAVYRFAGERGLRVIEDAAHAFGCTYRGKRIGSAADVACFSFDGIKNITTGEGGAVVTSDPTVGARVRDARLLGVEKDSDKRYRGQRSWDFDVSRPGHRYHMSNIFAAIGRVQLARLDREFAPARIALALRYRTGLEGATGVTFFNTDLGAVVPHIQPVRIMDGRRDAVRAALEDARIQTGIHYKPNHLLTLFGGGTPRLPVTEQLYEEILSLPLHPGVTFDDVDRVCGIVRTVAARPHEVA